MFAPDWIRTAGRSALALVLMLLGLGSIVGSSSNSIAKNFTFGATGPERIEAGSEGAFTVTCFSVAGVTYRLDWIDEAGNVLPGVRFDAGVLIPSVKVQSSVSADEPIQCTDKLTLRFPTLDSATLGLRTYRLRAHATVNSQGGLTSSEDEFSIIRFEIVAPHADDFSLQLPAQVVFNPGQSNAPPAQIPLTIGRQGYEGPVELSWRFVEPLAQGFLSVLPSVSAIPNPLQPGDSAATLTITPSTVVPRAVSALLVTARGGNTTRTRLVTFVTTGALPATPTGLTAQPEPRAAVLRWDDGGDFVNYRLERSTDGVAFLVLQASLDPHTNTYRDTGLTPATEYTYRLTAFNVNGESPPALVTTTTLAAQTTFQLTVNVQGSGSVSSTPAGIASCIASCSAQFTADASVELVATPQAGAALTGWSGDCHGTAATSTVIMSAARSCTAQFTTVAAGGWQTLATLASHLDTEIRSVIALDAGGEPYVGYLLPVGTQSRLIVRREGNGGFPFVGFGALNANASWSAFSPQLLVDATGHPVLAFNMDLQTNALARGDDQGPWMLATTNFNLTANATTRVRMARSGDTLLFAWVETQQIAVRRYDLVTGQFDQGAFVPGVVNPRDLDVAVDSAGHAVIAWSDGVVEMHLHAIRETGPGTWVPLGGDIGIRPTSGPDIVQLGLHVDSNDIVRLVWINGRQNYTLSGAYFDGANWLALPGKAPDMRLAQTAFQIRALSVNHGPELFAFAYAWDRDQPGTESEIFVQQFVGGALIQVGSTLSTTHPQVQDLALAMSGVDRAVLAHSQYTPSDLAEPYKLIVRRHTP